MSRNRKNNTKVLQTEGDTSESKEKDAISEPEFKRSSFHILCGKYFDLGKIEGLLLFIVIIVLIGICINFIPSIYYKHPVFIPQKETYEKLRALEKKYEPEKPIFWIFLNSKRDDHLVHVKNVLSSLGFKQKTNTSDWSLLWAHDYPFIKVNDLYNLKPHQRVNHFPGCGYITNKVDLCTSNLESIPKSFKLPNDIESLKKYANDNPNKMFVQKHNKHRHIMIKPLKSIDLHNINDSFIQEYIDKPLLVDGFKFDIGVYTIITSVKPLRVYIYNGDILFRYCAKKYYPFDSTNVSKYVVGDDYLPTWEIPALREYYTELGYGMKASFDAYIRSLDRDPQIIWDQVESAIRNAILAKEEKLISSLKSYNSKNNFFEMMRFDLVVDSNLKVFLMEANMSPNLSSAHFEPNKLLYEQVIYNMLNLVGIGSFIYRESLRNRSTTTELMLSANKNIVTNPLVCSQLPCNETCTPDICSLCLPCLNENNLNELHLAYREHMRKGDTKRIFPPAIKDNKVDDELMQRLTPENKFITNWFYGKCQLDATWCM